MISVSCIMPTANRRRFVPSAVRMFLEQDFGNKELLVIDDGVDAVEDLIPKHPSIRYVRLEQRVPLGEKRNIACEMARGEIIAHWDDDDWYAPWRLTYQVTALLASCADIGGVRGALFVDPAAHAAWEYVYPVRARQWVCGATLCYLKSYWIRHRFAPVQIGEDTRFVLSAHDARTIVNDKNQYFVGLIHAANTARKRTTRPYWEPRSFDAILSIIGNHWPEVIDAAAGTGGRCSSSCELTVTIGPRIRKRSSLIGSGVVLGSAADHSLTEFGAWNATRTSADAAVNWAEPFAAFHAYLDSASTALDSSLDGPAFLDRLRLLYRNAALRHCPPTSEGLRGLQEIAPASCDRIFCLNTLERLPQNDRLALLKGLVSKLKPNGAFVIAHDNAPIIQQASPSLEPPSAPLVPPSQIIQEINECLAPYGFRAQTSPPAPAGSEPSAEAAQDDQLRFAYGAIFSAGGRLISSNQRRSIVLGLLTWNTKAVSLTSLDRHLTEAATLRRLGHDALICVCDNGSTDGTAEALKELDRSLSGVPHEFIFNATNIGNSRARNQIIDVALEKMADYLLFVDGDIEIVPFSSFVMMRYLEDIGGSVACIGALSSKCSARREQCSKTMFELFPEAEASVAWTQYGLFRCDAFRDGVRFDEEPPFDGIGWGFEDNDLGFQLLTNGYEIHKFANIRYSHQRIGSSVRIMRGLGIDPNIIFQRRKRRLLDKWADSFVNLEPFRRMGRVPY